MGALLLLFTMVLVPAVELFLLIRIGSVIGPLNTLALLLLTGIVGAWLARSEGLRVLRQWQNAVQQGYVPEDGVLSGLLVLVGGVLLITPGILTDLVGLWLLLPASRRAASRLLRHYVRRQVDGGRVHVHTYGAGGFGGGHGPFDARAARGGQGTRPRGAPHARRPRPAPNGDVIERPVPDGDVIETSGEEVR